MDTPLARVLRLPLPLPRGRLLRRRAGLGSLTDFQSFNQPGSDFAKAWQPIAQQLVVEGASQTELQAAANDFTSSFEQLTSSAAGFGLDTSSALSAAAQYTQAGRTILGAVQHVSGLIQAAEGAKTPQEVKQVFEMFTGTLIGVAAAAGVVSAGVGSLIVAGIAVAMDLLQSAGLFGTAPSGVTICAQGGSTLTSQRGTPTVQVGCAFSTTAPVVNAGSANWRRFPSKASDPGWFSDSQTTWHGDQWGGWSNLRLIDSAFPEYHYLACMSVPPELADFHRAFSSAWTANKEYALNGLKSQSDAEVLLHAVRIWNRAHQSTSYYDLGPATFSQGPAGYIYHPTLAEIQAGQTQFGASLCSPTGYPNAPAPPYYGALLMNDVRNLVGADDAANSMVGGNLRIFTGDYKPLLQVSGGALYKWDYQKNAWVVVMTAAQLQALEAKIAEASASLHTQQGPTPLQTAAIVGGGAIVAAAAGGSLYAVATGQAVGPFWMGLWGKAVTGGVKALRAVGVRV